jgi:hypothetical protein
VKLVTAHEVTARDAFGWIDPDVAAGMAAADCQTVESDVSTTSGTLLAHRSSGRPVTVTAAAMSLLPVVPPAHECAGPPVGEKMPLTNLCNRSVVTSTLGNPRSRAQGSHPADRRFRGRPFSSAALPTRERSSVHGGAERPRGPSDLEWHRAWRRSRQLEPVFDLPPSGPWPETVVSRRSSRSACSASHEVIDQTPDAPCRAALPTRPLRDRAGL